MESLPEPEHRAPPQNRIQNPDPVPHLGQSSEPRPKPRTEPRTWNHIPDWEPEPNCTHSLGSQSQTRTQRQNLKLDHQPRALNPMLDPETDSGPLSSPETQTRAQNKS